MKTNENAEEYLRSLGLSWITIAEAMSDENYDRTIALLTKNPKITKKELLAAIDLIEYKY